jgi:hypothetical protein
MLPYSVYDVVRAIHEDRIRDAQKPWPEWIDIPAPRQHQLGRDGLRQHVRSSFADALRRLAARVDPQGSAAHA